MSQIFTRRGFIGGLLAAPAVVAASSLMPVRSVERFLWPIPAWCPEGYLPCDGRPVPPNWSELLSPWPEARLPDLRTTMALFDFPTIDMGENYPKILRWAVSRDLMVKQFSR